MNVVIEELDLPDNLDGPHGDEFRDLIALRNQVEVDTLGTDAISVTPEAIFPHFSSTPQKSRRHFVVRDEGRMVARGLFSWQTAADAPAAFVMADVLPSYRRRGIGTALFEAQEQLAAELGRKVIQVSVIHTSSEGGERLASPTGFGDLPASDPGVQFLLSRGYQLEQVVRISTLDLSSAAASLTQHREAARAKAGPDYRVVSWVGPTPEKWLDSKAELATAMSLADPSAGLEVVEDVWDADRVREHDER